MIQVTCENGLVVCFDANDVVCMTDGSTKLASELQAGDRFSSPPMGAQIVDSTEAY